MVQETLVAIPDYQSLMLPLLQYSADGEEHQLRATIEALADRFSLTMEERNELLPSGSRPFLTDRVSWARTYLKQAGLLSVPGPWVVTSATSSTKPTPPTEQKQRALLDSSSHLAPNDAEDFPAPNDTLSGHVLAEQDI